MNHDNTGQAAATSREMEQLQRELELARKKLAESYKMVSLGRLVAGIVHEINTPIGSILSNNQVILRSLDKLKRILSVDVSPPEAALDIIDTMMSLAAVDKLACERISSVIRGLKTFSRIDEGDFREADLHEIIQNTIKLSDCEFRRRVKVVTEFGDVPQVECYPHMLNQVFLNILVNAAQAIEGEGTIVIKTGVETGFVHIDIRDSGEGIRAEDRARIFSPGFSTKPIGIGTGLGLSISREIVEDIHGGAISFDSEVGLGTTFHIRLPLRRPVRAELERTGQL